MTSIQNLNKVQLLGNLGARPELQNTKNGVSFTHLSIATNHSVKNPQGGFDEKTYWHRVLVWNKRAELCCRYLDKGSRVFVEGQLRPGSYTDKTGNERYSNDIIADDIKFLGHNTEKKSIAS